MTEPARTYEGSTHTYKINDREVPSVTQILVEAGIINTRWYTEWARHRGSTVHKVLEFLVKGTLDLNSVDDRIVGYIDAYNRFCEDTGFICDEVERRVWNMTAQYGGTLDQLGGTDKYRAIVDTKTGPLMDPTGLQLTGYAKAIYDETGAYPERLIGVQLNVDGSYRMRRYVPDFLAWDACVRVAWWKREH